MQNESYVKHQHVPVVRPVWKLVFLLVMKILEGARALVSSSLDQLLQAFLGRGHLCPWLCLKCHLPAGCICSRLAQSLTRPKKRGRLSQVRTPDFTSWNWVSWKKSARHINLQIATYHVDYAANDAVHCAMTAFLGLQQFLFRPQDAQCKAPRTDSKWKVLTLVFKGCWNEPHPEPSDIILSFQPVIRWIWANSLLTGSILGGKCPMIGCKI